MEQIKRKQGKQGGSWDLFQTERNMRKYTEATILKNNTGASV